jgi:hypothetical protein
MFSGISTFSFVPAKMAQLQHESWSLLRTLVKKQHASAVGRLKMQQLRKLQTNGMIGFRLMFGK